MHEDNAMHGASHCAVIGEPGFISHAQHFLKIKGNLLGRMNNLAGNKGSQAPLALKAFQRDSRSRAEPHLADQILL